MMKKFKTTLLQFFKFGLVGISNTLIALIVYYVWLFFIPNYMQANFVSWAVSVLNAFFWNRKYVFKSSQNWKYVLAKTYFSYGVSLFVSMCLLYFQIEQLGISDKLAPIGSLLVTIPLNFFLNKFWAFR